MTEREEFEMWAKDQFECSEFAFNYIYPDGYYNYVSRHTYGGRITPDYSSVAMLWRTWQAGRAPLLARIAELEAAAGKVRDDALEEAAVYCDPIEGHLFEKVSLGNRIRTLKQEGK